MKSYFATAAHALATTFTNFFRKPVTVEFPDVIRPRAERYRASFALLHEEDGDEACIGCLQCERICPSEVISIKAAGKRESPITGKKRGYADDFVLDLNACIYCELCVQVCPTDAIVMTREPELPAFGREDLVLTMAKLYANEKSKVRAWGDATRLNGMQTPPKPPKVASAAASAAPAAAPTAPGAAPAATAGPAGPGASSAPAAGPAPSTPAASGPAPVAVATPAVPGASNTPGAVPAPAGPATPAASGPLTAPTAAPAPAVAGTPAAAVVPLPARAAEASDETVGAGERGSMPSGSGGEGTS